MSPLNSSIKPTFMSKNKIYLIVIVSLILSHVVLFSIPFLKGPKKEYPRKVIIQELGFSEEQIALYDTLIDAHRKSIHKLNEKIKKERALYYTALNKERGVGNLGNISEAQLRIEQTHFLHFLSLRALCNDAQKKKFDALTPKIQNIFFKAPKK